MKKLFLVVAMFCSIYGMAQENSAEIHFPRITTHNGAMIGTTYTPSTAILSVEVAGNEDEVEILVVDNGAVVDSETTVFVDETVNFDLSSHKKRNLTIYARTRNEVQYVGNVETESK